MFEIGTEVENSEDFLQGDDGIAMRVVKRIVEVDEKVGIGERGAHG